jgi:hypothetical protein
LKGNEEEKERQEERAKIHFYLNFLIMDSAKCETEG